MDLTHKPNAERGGTFRVPAPWWTLKDTRNVAIFVRFNRRCTTVPRLRRAGRV
jgi:hypothetical protein